jgi:hypothetical protein
VIAVIENIDRQPLSNDQEAETTITAKQYIDTVSGITDRKDSSYQMKMKDGTGMILLIRDEINLRGTKFVMS